MSHEKKLEKQKGNYKIKNWNIIMLTDKNWYIGFWL